MDNGAETMSSGYEADPFPQLKSRDVFNLVGWYIVQSNYKQYDLNEEVQRLPLSDHVKTTLFDFNNMIGLRYKTFPKPIQETYVKYWEKLWDICIRHLLIGQKGADQFDPDTQSDIADRYFNDQPEPQKLSVEQGLHFIDENDYHGLLEYVKQETNKDLSLIFSILRTGFDQLGLEFAHIDAMLLLGLSQKKWAKFDEE